MYGGGFVQGDFVRGGFVQGGFVRRGFCPAFVNSIVMRCNGGIMTEDQWPAWRYLYR